MKHSKELEIAALLFKDFLTPYNSRSISKKIGISHAGAFKILKKMEKQELVNSRVIGKAVIYSMNLINPIACREIEMALTIEAQGYKRWLEEFKDLENTAEFTILFGSILTNEKYAKDIDILVVSKADNFERIKKNINEKNKVSNKKIHPIIQNLEDFKKDIMDKNIVVIEIIKKGIVLFGQDKLRKIVII